MCGRFAVTVPIAQIIEQFEIEQNLCDLAPSYNVAPGQEVAAIVIDENKKLVKFKWGLMPSWMKKDAKPAGMINARAETIKEKPSFRSSFKNRRCLIIASGFYEWRREGKEKIPVYIRMKNGEPFCFAGIYDFWKSAEGKTIGTCAIITTEANSLIEKIHERMPVILDKKDHKLWLDCAQDEQLVLPLLASFSPDEMETYEVGKLVNSPANNSPECIEPVKKGSE